MCDFFVLLRVLILKDLASAAELSGDWNKKEKREQAPALHMEFSTGLNIAGSESKSIDKESAIGED